MALQCDLFGETTPVVPGLAMAHEAISPENEADLAARIDAAPLEPFKFGQWRGKRLTCSYGSAYDYQRGKLADAPPVPDWLLKLRARLAPQVERNPADFAQALLIRYDPGAGIGWHRDRPQYAEVLGLSLGAPCVLRLRRRLGEGEGGGFERRKIELPPRSLYRLSGEVRQEWEHSIAPMEGATRRSVTFRSLR